MLDLLMNVPSAILGGMIQGEPGAIIGPISTAFGFIIDFIFRGLSAITPINALGFSIIIITMIVRGGLVPSQLKMQQNSRKTQAIKPEMDKIKEKYGNSKDPELRRKMAAEIQALNQKHGISMVSSCLPLLITMPIFIALFAVFGRAFLFIPSITDVYSGLSNSLLELGFPFYRDVLSGIINQYLPTAMEFNPQYVPDLNRALHVFTDTDWRVIFGVLEGQSLAQIYENYGVNAIQGLRINELGNLVRMPITQAELSALYAELPTQAVANVRYYFDTKTQIESFFGLNLVTPSGWAFPGVIIPILSVATMAFSSYQTTKMNPATDPQMIMMQRMTMFVLPIMFGWFTIGAASAVGLYWVAGNVFLIAQNFIVHKYFAHKISVDVVKK